MAQGKQSALELIEPLVQTKVSYLLPMTVIFLVGYVGLTVLAGFAKDLLAMKVIGAFNLGFMLILANYVLSWVLAIIYGRIANSKFDPMAKKVVNELKATGASR